jgi:hypothetical protein
MVTRRRNFVVVSLSILLAGIGAGLASISTGWPLNVFAQQEKTDELRLVPRDASFIAFANIRQIMASDLRETIRRVLPLSEPAQRELERQTGISLERDVDYILACAMPSPGSIEAESPGLLLVRGRFDGQKVETTLQGRGARVEVHNGKRVVVIERGELGAPPIAGDADSSKTPPLGLSFIEPGLAAVGTPDLVRAAINLQRGGSSVVTNSEMMQHVRSLDVGNVWAVGRLDTLGQNGRLPFAFADQLTSITWLSLSGNVDTGMRGMLKAETRDEKAAAQLREVVRSFITLIKLQASSSRPEMQAVLNSIELGGMGTTVAVSFQVPAVVMNEVTPRPDTLPGP